MLSKIKLYRAYKKSIKSLEKEVYDNFKLERDYVNRLYTVINIDPKIVNQYYPEDVSSPIVKEYVTKVDRYMRAQGLGELIAIREITRLDNFNVKVVFGFSLFDTAKRANRIATYTIVSVILAILSLIIFF